MIQKMRHSDKWKILFDKSNRNPSYPIFVAYSCKAILDEVKTYVGKAVQRFEVREDFYWRGWRAGFPTFFYSDYVCKLTTPYYAFFSI